MGKQGTGRPWPLKLLGLVAPGLGFGLAFGYITGQWLSSIATSLTISATITVLYELDRALIHPRLEHLSRDWRLGLELAFSLLEHTLGALLAYVICSLVFDFGLGSTTAWVWIGFVGLVFFISLIVHSTGYALSFYQELKAKELLEEQLRALTAQAELKALKAQINPHFLFNTLNIIAELTHADPARAEATVERLAEMFRYVLAGSERGLVPLEEELAFVDDYLAIEQARFGERLRVVREIDPAALRVPVPSLILQPLVENAVRHGWGPNGSIDLAIRVQHHGDEVHIAIADGGLGLPPGYRIGQDPGHGLRNVDKRLRKTYGEAHGLAIAAHEPQGTVVTVRVPVESKE